MTNRELWLADLRSSGKYSERDLSILARASRVLTDNTFEQKDRPWGRCRGICPSPTTYRGVWNWDSAFHALAVSRWDLPLAREQYQIFFECQTEDGMFPDVIFEDGKRMDNYSKPPVFPWSFAEVYRRNPDLEYLKMAYPYYVKNEAFWRTKRFVEAEGLFHYDATRVDDDWLTHVKWESGMDDSVRWDKKIKELWPVDLNAYMVTFYDAMAFLAKELNNGEEAGWLKKRDALAEKINTLLWDEERQSYMDVDRETKRSTGVLTPASFAPLFAGCAAKERAAAMAAHASNKEEFYPTMPSVSYDNPEFKADLFWRGPVWLNMAYFAAKGLKDYGFDKEADTIRNTLLDWADKEKRDIFEYYNPLTGEGTGASHFGWSSVFLIEFVLNWD